MSDTATLQRPAFRAADVIATALLLVAQMLCAAYAFLFVAIGASMGTDACSISDDDPCNWTAIGVAVWTTLPVLAVCVIASPIVSIKRMATDRYTCAVPLIALAIQIAVTAVCLHVLGGAT